MTGRQQGRKKRKTTRLLFIDAVNAKDNDALENLLADDGSANDGVPIDEWLSERLAEFPDLTLTGVRPRSRSRVTVWRTDDEGRHIPIAVWKLDFDAEKRIARISERSLAALVDD
ncbi:MAG: hypothetical protein U9N56_05755 [Actinomycetota bacterium]|nr:hypothetical protein [Actinomycetota bacterium]